MSLELNILEQLIATEFDASENIILETNKGNSRTGLIEFNTTNRSLSNIPVEELVSSFYRHSGYNLSKVEFNKFPGRDMEILRFTAEKINRTMHKYKINILKTSYHNSIFILQAE